MSRVAEPLLQTCCLCVLFQVLPEKKQHSLCAGWFVVVQQLRRQPPENAGTLTTALTFGTRGRLANRFLTSAGKQRHHCHCLKYLLGHLKCSSTMIQCFHLKQVTLEYSLLCISLLAYLLWVWHEDKGHVRLLI